MSVDMRITLPWFIELNPSARVTASNFRYPSHRLRFDMKRLTEPLETFQARINAAAETSEAVSSVSGSDKNWFLDTASVIKGLCIRISGEALRQSWLTMGTSPFSRARAGGKHDVL